MMAITNSLTLIMIINYVTDELQLHYATVFWLYIVVSDVLDVAEKCQWKIV